MRPRTRVAVKGLTIDTLVLRNTSIETSRLGFGCGGLMRSSSAAERQRVLSAAFDHGIRHFDVARMYGLGAAEGELGRFLRGRRDRVVVATKFGIEPAGAIGGLARLQGPARALLARFPALRRYVKGRGDRLHTGGTYDVDTARSSLERSLRALGTDHVDIYLLHDPSPGAARTDELAAYLEEVKRKGQIRAWGVSGDEQVGVEVEQAVGSPIVLQAQDDILRRAGGSRHPSVAVTFKALADPLVRVRDHLAASPDRAARWASAVGADCSRQDTLAGLLLRDALYANPGRCMLFSTSRPEHVPTAVAAEAAVAAGERDEQLAAFQRLVRDELASPLAHGV